jgi:hypothetical protein
MSHAMVPPFFIARMPGMRGGGLQGLFVFLGIVSIWGFFLIIRGLRQLQQNAPKTESGAGGM